jgi:hypothetical protein
MYATTVLIAINMTEVGVDIRSLTRKNNDSNANEQISIPDPDIDEKIPPKTAHELMSSNIEQSFQ